MIAPHLDFPENMATTKSDHTQAQNVDKNYSTKSFSDSTVYFVLPIQPRFSIYLS